LQLPVFGVTLTKVVPVGVASVTLTPRAVSGPLFFGGERVREVSRQS